MNKVCRKCHVEKQIQEYSKAKQAKDGYLNICKQCFNIYRNNRRKNDIIRNKININYKRYRYNNPAKMLFLAAKYRAKKQGIIIEINENDIIIPNICPVLNIPLFINNKKMGDNSPSIDRIDNQKGYIKNNIKIISWRANAIKGDATIEELEKIKDYMYNNLKGDTNE